MALSFTLSHCQRCSTELPERVWAEGSGSCPVCGNQVLGLVFPALTRKLAPAAPAEVLQSSDEASCFYHAQKRAVVACDSCGRFLCSLCEVDWAGRTVCPPCVQSTASKPGGELDQRRTLWDSIALGLSLLPLLLFYFTLFTAPFTIFLIVRYWNAPGSLIPRTRIRFYAAALISLLQIAGWAWFFIFIAAYARR